MPIPGKEGEVRLADRDALVEELIRRSLDQAYAKMSRDLSASRMVVDETQRRASDAGIGFSIHTTHTTPEGPTTVAATHDFPFGQQYAITLMVVARGATRGAGARSTPPTRSSVASATFTRSPSISWSSSRPSPRLGPCLRAQKRT